MKKFLESKPLAVANELNKKKTGAMTTDTLFGIWDPWRNYFTRSIRQDKISENPLKELWNKTNLKARYDEARKRVFAYGLKKVLNAN